MLPKRKLIKKRHQKPTQDNTEHTSPASLLEKLRSVEEGHAEEALAYVASMCLFSEGPREMALIAEIVALLRRGSQPLAHQCLYALANIAELSPSSVAKMFEFGLDKALLQLNSQQKQLLRPIMVLMLALHPTLPSPYQFLEKGVQSSLTPQHLDSPSKGLVLQFLARLESEPPNILAKKIQEMFRNEEQLRIRSLSLQVLLQWGEARQKLTGEVGEYCQELLRDIDLQKEYSTNIVKAKPVTMKNKDCTETDLMEEQHAEEVSPVHHINYDTFIDTSEAVELLSETLLDILEDQWQEDDEDDEEEGIEVQNQQQNDSLTQTVIAFITHQWQAIAKNCVLSFPEGQNIVALSLRLLCHCSIDPVLLAPAVFAAIRNTGQINPPEQVMAEILTMSIHLLLKCPVPEQERELLIVLGEKGLRVKDHFKDAWVRLLQLYSIHFNPEKQPVSTQENHRVGVVLKNLIINIPHLQLEEWRAQTLDTLFDVYSNEQFDKTFVELGFMDILLTVAERAGTGKKKKFVKQVLADVTRFIDYKRKMIQF